MRILSSFFLAAIFSLTGCGLSQSVSGSAALGGVGGAALGAGAGAAAAYVLDDGLVSESIAAGAGLGLAAGAVLGAAQKTIRNNMTIWSNDSAIADNKEQIYNTNRQIELMRAELDADAADTEVNPALIEEKNYMGPRLGNYFRP